MCEWVQSGSLGKGSPRQMLGLLHRRKAGAGKVWLSQPGQDQRIFNPELLCGRIGIVPRLLPLHPAKLWLVSSRCCAGEEVGFPPVIPPVLLPPGASGAGQAGGVIPWRGLSPHLPSCWAVARVHCETQPDLSFSFFYLFLLLTCTSNSRLWSWLACGLKKKFF